MSSIIFFFFFLGWFFNHLFNFWNLNCLDHPRSPNMKTQDSPINQIWEFGGLMLITKANKFCQTTTINMATCTRNCWWLLFFFGKGIAYVKTSGNVIQWFPSRSKLVAIVRPEDFLDKGHATYLNHINFNKLKVGSSTLIVNMNSSVLRWLGIWDANQLR